MYGRSLIKDSKRFQLQLKYQNIDKTVIAQANAKILSYYVDFINEADVVLDTTLYKELLVLADYMTSPKFTHEVHWQCLHKNIMRRYLHLYSIYGGNDNSGALSQIMCCPEDEGYCIDTVLKTISGYVLEMKLKHNRDIIKEIGNQVKTVLLHSMFLDDIVFIDHVVHFVKFLKYINYEHLSSRDTFEAVYGTSKEILCAMVTSGEYIKKYVMNILSDYETKMLN